MMTREEVAEVMIYCKENGISYKDKLARLCRALCKFHSENNDDRTIVFPVAAGGDWHAR